MPLDDYAAVGGGGALRLKGAKVTKPKKKKKKDKADLEKALSEAGGESLALVKKDSGEGVVEKKSKKSRKGQDEEEDDEEDVPVARKTEAQRKLDEVRRKRFLELAENPDARPELLKTHKERVEELNSFLSKLSEHNDMPKIGPG